MALAHLTDEQIRTWTREQKDRWWFENIFRGDLPQLTLRSGLTGFLLGGILSATNLYIGGKAGVTLGVNLTSVILAFVMFRLLARLGLAKDFTILENNAMQSIATAAGYMTVPLISSLAAYMMITNHIVPWWQMVIWMVIMSLVGVLVAFPMKRRFINEDQLPFPEGRACGVVLDALYHGAAGEGVFKAKLLGVSAGLTALYQFLISDGLQRLVQFSLLRLNKTLGWTEPWHIHERLDDYYYMLAAKYQLWTPKILGTDFKTLGLRLTLDVAMLGVGGLMGVRVATSVVLGTVINFMVLAPIMIARGDIAPRPGPTGAIVPLSRAEIVNQWSLWWGVSMMVVGSIIALAGKPEIFTSVFKNLRGKKKASGGEDVLKDIELPLWISYVGVPVLCVLGCYVTHLFFGVPMWLALALAPARSRPHRHLRELDGAHFVDADQFAEQDHAVRHRRDRSHQSGLQPHHRRHHRRGRFQRRQPPLRYQARLHARRQAAATSHRSRHRHHLRRDRGHALVLRALPHPECGRRALASSIASEKFPMPNALQWRGVAELIARGVSSLPQSVIISMICAAVVGRGDRDRHHHPAQTVSAFLRLDRARSHPPARVLPHDVARRDVLLVASAPPCRGQRRASQMGGRNGTDLRRHDHWRGPHRHRQRADQRARLQRRSEHSPRPMRSRPRESTPLRSRAACAVHPRRHHAT